ncbi:MAG TPA: ABC transporter permease [Candidatus Dormibacteraeota bacterium]|jgi:peptide/nickel transport system permease protein|nr:ABC transporter permease [Candidatus Dormibacteraeota bacterium]
MWRYVVRRLLLGALTILVITFVVYALLWALPEKPYAFLINRPNQSLAARDAIIARFGADKPFIYQYGIFLKNLVHLDLGESLTQHTSVANAIGLRIGNTALLMISSYIVTLLIAVPIGIISAVRQYSKLDNVVTSLSFVGISLPNFWFGSMLIFAFAVFPHEHGFPTIFPEGGMHSNNATGLLDLAWHLVLPIVVLAVQGIAQYARYIRSSMLEVLSQDYIRTARAKGLAERRIVLRHALRNSLLPLITLMGLDIPQLFVGAVITEFVFNWPGMGRLFVDSAAANDYSILLGILLILSVFVVVGNLLADLAYTWADPRISYDTGR